MFAARGALRLAQRLASVTVQRRGCAGAVPVDDIVNGLTDEQIQVDSPVLNKIIHGFLCFDFKPCISSGMQYIF